MDTQSPAGGRTTVDEARNRAMGAGVVDDPYPKLHELRAQCPVHRGAAAVEFGVGSPVGSADIEQYSVLSYEAALRTFRDHTAISSHWFQKAIGATVGNALIALDPPEHQRHRSLLQPAFAIREMERWQRDIVSPIVTGHLDELAPKGRADLYADFAAFVPVEVTAAALGLPPK